MVVMTAWLAVTVPWFCTANDNLLRNAGFETVEGGMPVQWNLFVQPQPGAEGRLDEQMSTEGTRAAYLHNPDTYAKDPCNNWSQNLTNPAAGRTLVAGGNIKTSGMADGAIWVQCWRKDPWGVLRIASTADAMPVSGDTDWKPVAVKLTVPSDTDFVVVRCVIRGAGSAWFDDLRLVEAETEAAPAPENPTAMPPVPPPSPPADNTNVPADIAREAAAMKKTIESLRDTNEALQHDLAEMRKEVSELRERLTPREPAVSPPPQKAIPPLIPHGYLEEKLRP